MKLNRKSNLVRIARLESTKDFMSILESEMIDND